MEALTHYSAAIDKLSASSSSEGDDQACGCGASKHQILLSKVLACRLKIGGSDMVEKAVEEAKKVCVTLYLVTFNLFGLTFVENLKITWVNN